mmetsp:Transcript_14651/g.25025  ORF Transcript_14651/g.25025 Transcript_14651/m.25025 type:complete len:284 (-) Transcript_14651:125-976(-)|eukprot:CAMPEP_0196656898 /NCGR_PEP_ID=MMETSP1086-20130531/20254_1 /TAXON_ID=77921 /ORGANISM="Cyanoptyche  gloeocystis , Strain SAG4.97" /LENGTH=283 /DNA_ID=CAMNT_0041989825 /DNA_START=85 /DNA_END=936 /DNA_ORIENTATION=+
MMRVASFGFVNAARVCSARSAIPAYRIALPATGTNALALLTASGSVRHGHAANPAIEEHLKPHIEPSPYIVPDQSVVDLKTRIAPENASDRVALGSVKFLRFFADLFFRKRYGHRAVVLETVAAVPGMVSAMVNHLRCLRSMKNEDMHVKALLEEAENERMHLMTYMEIAKPTILERSLVFLVQGLFFNVYCIAYTFFPKSCHRFVGYLEEEAVVSYTQYLKEIDEGRIPNTPAPKIAIEYWKLAPNATLRDVVVATRTDEVNHRDVNHFIADEILAKRRASA